MERFPPESILVPADFSDCSEAAVRTAIQLGEKWDSLLHIVHVNDYAPTLLRQSPEAAAVNDWLRQYHEGAEQRLRNRVENYPRKRIQLLEGYPKEVLGEMTGEGRDDLVIMGTHGRSSLGHILLGSTAEWVIRTSTIPVLTVHARSDRMGFGRILVPMNWTSYSEYALMYASRLADDLGARLGVLHVVRKHDDPVAASDMLARHVRKLLGALPAKKVEMIVTKGEPADSILRTAAPPEFDLIVLSAHRKPFWKSWRLGQTAELVLRYSTVPVLSISSVETPKRTIEAARASYTAKTPSAR